MTDLHQAMRDVLLERLGEDAARVAVVTLSDRELEQVLVTGPAWERHEQVDVMRLVSIQRYRDYLLDEHPEALAVARDAWLDGRHDDARGILGLPTAHDGSREK